MAPDSVLAFWTLALLLIAVPGPDWAFTLGVGLSGGRMLPAIGGLVIGYSAMTAVVCLGVGALVAVSPMALDLLSVFGGGYLIWLGGTIFAKAGAPTVSAHAEPSHSWAALRRGIGVSGLNPKGLIMFVALLPRFTKLDSGWPVALQIAFLGALFTITCAIFYLGLGTAARALLRKRPGAAPLIARLSGAAMVVMGAVLLGESGWG